MAGAILVTVGCGGPQNSVTDHEEMWKDAEGSAEAEPAAPPDEAAPTERPPCPEPEHTDPALGRVGDEEIDPAEAHRQAILAEYDTDGNKWLDNEELATMYRLRAGEAFLQADWNRDGRLSVVEASGACGAMARGAVEEYATVDNDGDGFISRFEFEAAVGAWLRRTSFDELPQLI
ncbi:MAG: hypothetical protein ACK2U9_09165, partial [Anaerolineae bacterium]